MPIVKREEVDALHAILADLHDERYPDRWGWHRAKYEGVSYRVRIRKVGNNFGACAEVQHKPRTLDGYQPTWLIMTYGMYTKTQDDFMNALGEAKI